MLRSGEPALSDRRNGGSRTGTCFLPPRRTAGFSTPQDCALRDQSCYGRNDSEGGVSQYYAKLNKGYAASERRGLAADQWPSLPFGSCRRGHFSRFTSIAPECSREVRATGGR